MRRVHHGYRVPNWALGLIAVGVLALGTWFAFTKELPWGKAYEVQGVFTTAQNIRVDSPVRIAGVDVGKVRAVETLSPEAAEQATAAAEGEQEADGTQDGPVAALVTMEIEDAGRPVKTDATMELRPRLFLEGNLFVDLKPGSPSAPEAQDGQVFGLEATATSVQLDQVLTTLQSDVREQLQITLDEFGSALIDYGGAEGFQEFYRTSPGANRYTALVNEATLGTEPHDLSNLIRNFDRVVDGFGRHPAQLSDLVTNFRIFAGSFAAEDEALADAIEELPEVLEAADPAFANLNASFPALRAFAREALPGTLTTPETLAEATPFIHQVRLLLSPEELGGLVAELRPTVPELARLSELSPAFLEQGRALSSCFNEVIIPWSESEVVPPENYPHPVAGKVHQETGYGLVGVAGESRSGDANGQWARVLGGGGTNLVRSQPSDAPSTDEAFALTPFPIEGGVPSLSPVEDSAKTPFRPNEPCEQQEPPNLGATLGAPPPQETASGSSTPGALGEAYDDYVSLAEDLARAKQLSEDGNEAAAAKLERQTNRAFDELLASYDEAVEAVTGVNVEGPGS